MTTAELDFENGILVIRCRNHADDPETCGESCGVPVTFDEAQGTAWITAILEGYPEWFIVLRSCPEHGRHADPFCCVSCFESFHARHEHKP